MNIALIGLRCAGKTTLGKLLADQLGRPFIDLDERVLAQFVQPTIADVWANLGEATWREAEERELQVALKESNGIIAFGGGTPMIPAARHLIDAKRQATDLLIVFLECNAAELARRRCSLNQDDRPTRPGESIEDEIKRTLRERSRAFEAIADFTLDVSARSQREAAIEIIDWVKSKRP